jgi:hypothetical protein
MWTRRQFLSRSSLALAGTAGTCFALPGDDRGFAEPRRGRDRRPLPDGSASRGMITPATDQAIQRGLNYLFRYRQNDGSFGTGRYHGNVAVTSLAALAFMASGSQPNRGPYGRVITDALRFVLHQENRGTGYPGFLKNPRDRSHGPMYGHGFGTLFLGEVSGMVHEKALREELHEKLRRAVRLIVQSQNHEGGWRYQPDSRDADLSVTICQIMALRSARNAGVVVPKSTIDRCVRYVKDCRNRDGSFRYMRQLPGFGGGAHRGFARTAAGIVALYSAGIYESPEVEAGLRYLINVKPSGFAVGRADIHYFYGHYYAVQAMWTAGEPYWSEWFHAIREELLNRQQRDNGSWEDQVCPHYATAMACLILQVPNNYLPILQK